MTPAALSKAEGLERFAKTTGAPLETFELILTLGEAYELLDWMPGAGMVHDSMRWLLEEDIAQAKLAGDPWRVLSQFRLRGFRMLNADEVLH